VEFVHAPENGQDPLGLHAELVVLGVGDLMLVHVEGREGDLVGRIVIALAVLSHHEFAAGYQDHVCDRRLRIRIFGGACRRTRAQRDQRY
jgi:hypothetical protein